MDEGQAVAEAPAQEAAPVAEATPKSYTEEQVSEIVSKRVNEWNKFGKPEEVQAKYARLEQMEQWAQQLQGRLAKQGETPGQANPPAAETEDDKKVRAYIDKLYPGLSKWQDQQKQLMNHVGSLEEHRWQAVTNNSRQSLKEIAVKAGYKEEQFGDLEQRVADSIRGNVQDHQAYLQTGNPAIVQKHFDMIDKWVKGFAPPPPAATTQYAKDKVKTALLPPRMPPGGVTAPTSNTKKLSDGERVSAAWEAFKKA